jgi:hypothetical protein
VLDLRDVRVVQHLELQKPAQFVGCLDEGLVLLDLLEKPIELLAAVVHDLQAVDANGLLCKHGAAGGGEGQGGRDVSEKCANSTMRAYICIAGSIPMVYMKLLSTNRAAGKRKAADVQRRHGEKIKVHKRAPIAVQHTWDCSSRGLPKGLGNGMR